MSIGFGAPKLQRNRAAKQRTIHLIIIVYDRIREGEYIVQ